MALYRKKPALVHAFQWDGVTHDFLIGLPHGTPAVMGKQGWVAIKVGDWIITEPDGSGHYPCADEIFRNSYEEVVDADA